MSVPYFSPQQLENLKQEATALKKREGLRQFVALDRIAVREGFRTWRELVAANRPVREVSVILPPPMKCITKYLGNGELPISEKIEGSTAIIIGEQGENILAVTKPSKVYFPLFEVEIETKTVEGALDGAQIRANTISAKFIKLAINDRIMAVRESVKAHAPECNQMILWYRTQLTQLHTGSGQLWFATIALGAVAVPNPVGPDAFSIEQAEFVADGLTDEARAGQMFGLN